MERKKQAIAQMQWLAFILLSEFRGDLFPCLGDFRRGFLRRFGDFRHRGIFRGFGELLRGDFFRHGVVRRAKLYYLRERSGKAAKIRERIVTK